MNHALANVFASKRVQLACGIEVFVEMRRLKLWVSRLAHIAVGKLTIRTHGAAQQSAAQGTVSERRDPVGQSVGQNVSFYFAFEEIVGRLNGVQRRNGPET